LEDVGVFSGVFFPNVLFHTIIGLGGLYVWLSGWVFCGVFLVFCAGGLVFCCVAQGGGKKSVAGVVRRFFVLLGIMVSLYVLGCVRINYVKQTLWSVLKLFDNTFFKSLVWFGDQ